MRNIVILAAILLGGCAHKAADPRAEAFCQSIGLQYLTAAYANCLANQTKQLEGKS